MEFFMRLSCGLARKLNFVSGICLVSMMTISCLDIILRFARMPFSGTYEIVSFLSAVMISFSMAQTTLDRSHVSVEILMSRFSRRIRQAAFVVTSGVTLGLLATLAYECCMYGLFFKQSGELSLTLQLPFYPILFGMSFAFIISCFIPLVDIYMVIFKDKNSWFRWSEHMKSFEM